MLKIKENVKLSELKQYGFTRIGNKYYLFNDDLFQNLSGDYTACQIVVNSNRVITYWFISPISRRTMDLITNTKLLNPTEYIEEDEIVGLKTLFVLIQKGLVEKVEE